MDRLMIVPDLSKAKRPGKTNAGGQTPLFFDSGPTAQGQMGMDLEAPGMSDVKKQPEPETDATAPKAEGAHEKNPWEMTIPTPAAERSAHQDAAAKHIVGRGAAIKLEPMDGYQRKYGSQGYGTHRVKVGDETVGHADIWHKDRKDILRNLHETGKDEDVFIDPDWLSTKQGDTAGAHQPKHEDTLGHRLVHDSSPAEEAAPAKRPQYLYEDEGGPDLPHAYRSPSRPWHGLINETDLQDHGIEKYHWSDDPEGAAGKKLHTSHPLPEHVVKQLGLEHTTKKHPWGGHEGEVQRAIMRLTDPSASDQQLRDAEETLRGGRSGNTRHMDDADIQRLHEVRWSLKHGYELDDVADDELIDKMPGLKDHVKKMREVGMAPRAGEDHDDWVARTNRGPFDPAKVPLFHTPDADGALHFARKGSLAGDSLHAGRFQRVPGGNPKYPTVPVKVDGQYGVVYMRPEHVEHFEKMTRGPAKTLPVPPPTDAPAPKTPASPAGPTPGPAEVAPPAPKKPARKSPRTAAEMKGQMTMEFSLAPQISLIKAAAGDDEPWVAQGVDPKAYEGADKLWIARGARASDYQERGQPGNLLTGAHDFALHAQRGHPAVEAEIDRRNASAPADLSRIYHRMDGLSIQEHSEHIQHHKQQLGKLATDLDLDGRNPERVAALEGHVRDHSDQANIALSKPPASMQDHELQAEHARLLGMHRRNDSGPGLRVGAYDPYDRDRAIRTLHQEASRRGVELSMKHEDPAQLVPPKPAAESAPASNLVIGKPNKKGQTAMEFSVRGDLSKSFSDAEMARANKTSRAGGAIGEDAVVPNYIRETTPKGESILDFGAGHSAQHALGLRREGHDVTAHEFGGNMVRGVHDPDALGRKYDHVYASNVLNVQSSKPMLSRTLDQIAGAVKPGGRAVMNFPESPRHGDFDHEHVQSELEQRFPGGVSIVGGSKRAPVFEARMPSDKMEKAAVGLGSGRNSRRPG